MGNQLNRSTSTAKDLINIAGAGMVHLFFPDPLAIVLMISFQSRVFGPPSSNIFDMVSSLAKDPTNMEATSFTWIGDMENFPASTGNRPLWKSGAGIGSLIRSFFSWVQNSGLFEPRGSPNIKDGRKMVHFNPVLIKYCSASHFVFWYPVPSGFTPFALIRIKRSIPTFSHWSIQDRAPSKCRSS